MEANTTPERPPDQRAWPWLEASWLRRAVVLVLVGVATYQVIGWAFGQLRTFLGLLFLSWMFSISMHPPVQALVRRGMRRGAATAVVMLSLLLLAIAFFAAFGALLRVLYVAFERSTWDFQPIIGTIAVLTMIVGAVLAVTQTDIKRLLAYSSIAHAGFILTGFLGIRSLNEAAGGLDGVSAVLFYLVAYGFTVIAAFAVVTLVRDADGEATHLSRWAGLGRRSPLFAAVFTFILLAFAGIPLTSGFTGKFAVFQAAVAGGATPLVIVGVLSSAIAAFFYVRVIVLMFFNDPTADGPLVVRSPTSTAAVAVGALATVVLGVVPGPALHLAQSAASQFFVR